MFILTLIIALNIIIMCLLRKMFPKGTYVLCTPSQYFLSMNCVIAVTRSIFGFSTFLLVVGDVLMCVSVVMWIVLGIVAGQQKSAHYSYKYHYNTVTILGTEIVWRYPTIIAKSCRISLGSCFIFSPKDSNQRAKV